MGPGVHHEQAQGLIQVGHAVGFQHHNQVICVPVLPAIQALGPLKDNKHKKSYSLPLVMRNLAVHPIPVADNALSVIVYPIPIAEHTLSVADHRIPIAEKSSCPPHPCG